LANTLLEMLVGFALPFVIVFMMLATPSILFLYGHDDFIDAAPLLQVVIWILIPRVFSQVFGYLLWANHQESTDLNITIANGVIWLFITVILTVQYGALGATVALLITELTDLALHYMSVSKTIFKVSLLAISWRPIFAGIIMAGYLEVVHSWNFLPEAITATLLYASVWLTLELWSAKGIDALKTKYMEVWVK